MSERKIIVKHASTVLVGQLAVVLFGVADTVIAGRYNPEALAILSLSASIYITVYVAMLGVIQAMLPLFAELNGAKKKPEIGVLFRQSLYIWVGLSLIGMALLLSPQWLMQWTEVPLSLQEGAGDYLGLLAVALPAALFFRLYSSLNQSLGKPRLVTWIQVGALALKVPLSVLLAFGWGIIPAMGLLGCALATVVVSACMMLIAMGLLRRHALYADLMLWQPLEPPDWTAVRQMLRIGIPNGLSVTVEVTSFTLMALLISRMGEVAAASHQIASNMAALLYMVPLSFSIAISARLSYWRGAENQQAVHHCLKIGFQLVLSLAVVLASLLWLFNESIAHWYTKDLAVAQLATTLLAVIGVFHLLDALQTICFFVLRSFKVTIAPMLIYSIPLWGIGLTGGSYLAYDGLGPFSAMQSPTAFWYMNILALTLVCAGLVILIQLQLKKSQAD
jgi:MATE family multidrug resistance protein